MRELTQSLEAERRTLTAQEARVQERLLAEEVAERNRVRELEMETQSSQLKLTEQLELLAQQRRDDMALAQKREQDYVEKLRALQVAVTDREQSLTDQQAYTDIIVRQLEEELQAQQQPQPPIIVHVPATSTATTNPFAIGSTTPIVPHKWHRCFVCCSDGA